MAKCLCGTDVGHRMTKKGSVNRNLRHLYDLEELLEAARDRVRADGPRRGGDPERLLVKLHELIDETSDAITVSHAVIHGLVDFDTIDWRQMRDRMNEAGALANLLLLPVDEARAAAMAAKR